MAKSRKKNNHYGNYQRPGEADKTPEKREKRLGYGLPGWLTATAFVMLAAALVLYFTIGDDLTGLPAVATYFLTGVPALIFTVGQNNRRREERAASATVLMAIFGVIAVIYLFSGFALLFQSLAA